MSGAKLLEVHGVQIELDPNLMPEKQHAISKQGKFERPQMGQGRAGSRRRKPDPINQAINQPLDVTQGIRIQKKRVVLAIPDSCTDKIITLYHKSLFTGHQGVIKTYLTISDKCFIPNLIHYLRSYIKGYHICQLSRNEKPSSRHLQMRINSNYIPMSRLSMDLKVMPRSHKGHRYILCIIDEVTNFLITVSIFRLDERK